ncbi:hypothetical protein IMCC21906_00330 [Spongiibacter sp. IMCC21906]|jgi:hypothetical protein|uniref:hypothetical protein n=1 Tax=Spongiibacter sp. IMCC21906 TaxID=1620392 RepID=UPI00062E0BDA|nr:hypothetical protein [Spongiibacter sp. IMCC21906]AKH68023.1 hypothetical protein IMCC21906_00330 [Spongiibacter sp. IMCC21906]
MRKLLIIISLGLFSATIHADIVARYTLGKETVVLSYKDAEHIRLDTSRGGYSLISGDRAVAVINQGGRQMVMDVDQMGAVISALRNKPKTEAIPTNDQVTITDTGEARQVAGIEGKVFMVNDGRQDYQVVLTDDKTVVKAGEAMAKFFRRFANSMNNEQGDRLLALEEVYRNHSHRGLLQAQGGLKLISIGEEERPDKIYNAPASAISFTMPGLTAPSNR